MTGTITYKYPTSAAPTVAQMLNLSLLQAQIVLTDGDTGVTIAHAMQVPTTNPLQPIVIVDFLVAPTTTLNTPLAIAFTDSSDITITKVAQTGSGFTALVTILRPNSLIT